MSLSLLPSAAAWMFFLPRQQARAAAELLAAATVLMQPLTGIQFITSDFKRARETAELSHAGLTGLGRK